MARAVPPSPGPRTRDDGGPRVAGT